MNNLEKIKSFSKDQMAAFIEYLDEIEDIADTQYCKHVCPNSTKKKCHATDISPCRNMSDNDCIKAWLDADTPLFGIEDI